MYYLTIYTHVLFDNLQCTIYLVIYWNVRFCVVTERTTGVVLSQMSHKSLHYRFLMLVVLRHIASTDLWKPRKGHLSALTDLWERTTNVVLSQISHTD